ncbi:MAG: phosphate signaling complex protein PhoU [Gammaproteobacteria bacterium]|nr:phosphate signaling complex protein PhoU [Gammaproteobacteria bacterium]
MSGNKEDVVPRQFDHELEDLRNSVLAMGGLVEEQLASSVKSLSRQDDELAKAVIAGDVRVNRMELEIDARCSQLIALRQPARSDLRLILAIIKTIADLERIGDEAEKISRLATENMMRERQKSDYGQLRHLGRHVRTMLSSALDAFARMDSQQARAVAGEDSEVDEEYESLVRQLITRMMEDPRKIREALDIMWAARALERVGDHAKNISQYVIYLVEDRDIRHRSVVRDDPR